MSDECNERPRTPGHPYLFFPLGDVLAGLDIDQLLCVVRPTPVTRVPRAPQFVSGIFDHRGQVVPLVDLHRRLNLSPPEYGYAARILVVEIDAQPVGILVGTTLGILHLPEEAILPASGPVGQIPGVYLAGVARHNGQSAVLLDLSRVLAWS